MLLAEGWSHRTGERHLRDRMMTVGEYRIEVSVFSDDAKPVTKVVSNKQGLSALQLHQIRESQRPPDEAPILPQGHLGEVLRGTEPLE